MHYYSRAGTGVFLQIPCDFWEKNVFLKSNRRTRSVFNLHRCSFRLPRPELWQVTEQMENHLGRTDIQVGGIISTHGLGNKPCLFWTQRLLCLICFAPVVLMHVLVIWIFINIVSIKVESLRKWKVHMDSHSKCEQHLLILIFYYSLCTILFLAFAEINDTRNDREGWIKAA